MIGSQSLQANGLNLRRRGHHTRVRPRNAIAMVPSRPVRALQPVLCAFESFLLGVEGGQTLRFLLLNGSGVQKFQGFASHCKPLPTIARVFQEKKFISPAQTVFQSVGADVFRTFASKVFEPYCSLL